MDEREKLTKELREINISILELEARKMQIKAKILKLRFEEDTTDGKNEG